MFFKIQIGLLVFNSFNVLLFGLRYGTNNIGSLVYTALSLAVQTLWFATSTKEKR